MLLGADGRLGSGRVVRRRLGCGPVGAGGEGVFVQPAGILLRDAAIRGAGDALFPMLMNLGGICVFRVLWLIIVLPLHRTLPTLTICYPISWVLTSVLFAVYYFRGRWLEKRIVDTAT